MKMKSYESLIEQITEAEMPSWVIPSGTPVSWDYRGTRGYGHIDGVHELGKDNASTMYTVSPSDRRFHPGEPATRIHSGADITRSTEDAIKNHIAELERKKG